MVAEQGAIHKKRRYRFSGLHSFSHLMMFRFTSKEVIKVSLEIGFKIRRWSGALVDKLVWDSYRYYLRKRAILITSSKCKA